MRASYWLAGSSSRQQRPLIGEAIFDVQAWSEKLYLLSRHGRKNRKLFATGIPIIPWTMVVMETLPIIAQQMEPLA